MAERPPRTLFSLDAVFPKLMLMCGAVIGGLCLVAGVLLAVVAMSGDASPAAVTATWWLIAIGLLLLIGCRWLFGRFIRGYLAGGADRTSDEVTHR